MKTKSRHKYQHTTHRQDPDPEDALARLKEQALSLGACQSITKARTIGDLIALLFTPQGREFYAQTGFPYWDTLRKHYDYKQHAQIATLFVGNTGGQTGEERGHVMPNCSILAYETNHITLYADRPETLYHVILMEGATLKVRTADYCTICVTRHKGRGEVIHTNPDESPNTRIIIDY